MDQSKAPANFNQLAIHCTRPATPEQYSGQPPYDYFSSVASQDIKVAGAGVLVTTLPFPVY